MAHLEAIATMARLEEAATMARLEAVATMVISEVATIVATRPHTAAVPLAEAGTADHSAEAVVMEAPAAVVGVAAVAVSGVRVRTRTSAFIIRCTSRIVHPA